MTASRSTLIACIVGPLATLLDVLCLSAMIESGVSVPLASGLAAAVGAVAGFLGNKYFAFRDRSPLTLRQMALFGGVALGTALLMAASMELVAVRLHIPYLPAKLVCATVMFFAWSLPAQRRFVFRAPAPHAAAVSRAMAAARTVAASASRIMPAVRAARPSQLVATAPDLAA